VNVLIFTNGNSGYDFYILILAEGLISMDQDFMTGFPSGTFINWIKC